MTRSVTVTCESTACLPPALAERCGIAVVPVPFAFGTETFLDGVDLTPAAFYRRLATASEPPTTSPPTPGAYVSAWETEGRAASDILLVTVAGSISTFARAAELARTLAHERLPSTTVTVLDSGSAAMGQGFVALAAARAARAGLGLDGVCQVARAVADRVNLVVTLDTLRYLAQAARIPRLAAVVGSALDIKPVIRLSRGAIEPLGRVRTRRRSLDELVEVVGRSTSGRSPLHLAVHHAQAADDATRVLERLTTRYHCVEAFITEFTPVMGAYCGPGLVGASFYEEL